MGETIIEYCCMYESELQELNKSIASLLEQKNGIRKQWTSAIDNKVSLQQQMDNKQKEIEELEREKEQLLLKSFS